MKEEQLNLNFETPKSPSQPREVYSAEKINRLKQKLGEFRLKLYKTGDRQCSEFEKEIEDFTGRLKGKYKVEEYAMMYALAGSTIDESRVKILHEDFPDEDSAEAFINYLLKHYY